MEEKDGVNYGVDNLHIRLFSYHLKRTNKLFIYIWSFLIAGKVEKPCQPTSKDKSALKTAAKETPAKLRNEKPKRPISKKKKQQIKAARESLASGELASEDKDRRIERDSRTLYLR